MTQPTARFDGGDTPVARSQVAPISVAAHFRVPPGSVSLSSVLPGSIAEKPNVESAVISDLCERATARFADVVRFTPMTGDESESALVQVESALPGRLGGEGAVRRHAGETAGQRHATAVQSPLA